MDVKRSQGRVVQGVAVGRITRAAVLWATCLVPVGTSAGVGDDWFLPAEAAWSYPY